jgi:hypothetical protein
MFRHVPISHQMFHGVPACENVQNEPTAMQHRSAIRESRHRCHREMSPKVTTANTKSTERSQIVGLVVGIALSFAVSGLAPRSALAIPTLTVDLRITGTSNGTVVHNKHVLVHGGVGTTVTMDIFAVITGQTNQIADEWLGHLHGSFLSSFGGLSGDLRAALHPAGSVHLGPRDSSRIWMVTQTSTLEVTMMHRAPISFGPTSANMRPAVPLTTLER